jgi:hypothetical protein
MEFVYSAEETEYAEKAARHPLSNAKLKRLAAKHKPPADWQGDTGLR